MIHIGNFRVRIASHTVNPSGFEAITWDACCERFIWAEFMTHRWARNASSSRAIPYRAKKKGKMGMVDWILQDPAMPLHLGSNRPGMQSGGLVADPEKAKDHILGMLKIMIAESDYLYDDLDLHKEIVNRYTEPWGWINFVATMGKAQLMNFFKLRIDKYAHPNIQRLAVNMARLYRKSRPRQLKVGEWHLPFVTEEQWSEYADANDATKITDLITWSVARSAWCSFKTVDDREATWEDAIKRYNDCIDLKHMTPCEHQLRARDDGQKLGLVPGYDQFRATIPGEMTTTFDFSILDTIYKDVDFVTAN